MGMVGSEIQHLKVPVLINTVFQNRMMLNTSQNLDQWQKYFDNPDGSKLGLMNAIYQIGSLASFPLVSVLPTTS
jgi:hypothetical protein